MSAPQTLGRSGGTGLGRLVRFSIRRDRVRLALWVLGIVVITVISAASQRDLYPDQAQIDSYVRLFGDNPALVAFAGPGYGFDDPNIGVILVNEVQLWGGVATALMSLFLVNRLTRAEEESERADLVRANVVGRHAPTAAAIIVVVVANLVVAVPLAVGFVALDYPMAGSIALAGSLAAIGVVFAGVAAVAAQLSGSSRATLGLGSVVLVAAFVLRAIGDIGGNVLTWCSPIGWAQAVRAYADERWWTLGLCVIVAAGLTAFAFWLSTRRDIGSGVFSTRPGRIAAGRTLAHPLGLAFRLHRGSFLAWPIGLFLTGVAYGSIGEDVDAMLEENPQLADFLARLGESSLTDSFFAVALTMLALIACGFTISMTLALRTEEGEGRAELVLAAPVARWRWAAGHLVVAAVGTLLTIAAGGFGVGVGYAAVTGDVGQIARLTGASVVTVPAALVALGVSVALFGWVPRWALFAWGVLAFMSIVGFLAEVLQLPQWIRGLSPFDHLPAVPAESFTLLGPLVVLGTAVALTLVGLVGLRRRDVGIR